ncbi:MAG: DUF4178 domain-containing protein [Candidatus Hydrogenedentota bacterium]|nr:MAG: DUF4178 domain-containing protein [Candidatus Hydrogenedentota bacterium]
MSSQYECPSCGAPIQVKNRASLYVVCEYCNTTSLRKDVNLEEVGKASGVVEDGSPIQLGTVGKWNNIPFEVIGRIQLHYALGFWNEWHLDLNGESAWLSESNGNYVISKKVEALVPKAEELKVYSYVDIAGKAFYVKDIQEATCISAQGELPFRFQEQYTAKMVDLANETLEFASIDYSDDPAGVYLGEFTDFFKLRLGNLREIYGFPIPKGEVA